MRAMDTRRIRTGRDPRTIINRRYAELVCQITERMTGDRCVIEWPSDMRFEVWRQTPEGKLVRV